jgi:hypothetical protein
MRHASLFVLCLLALRVHAVPFGIQVVDDASGAPVPMVTLETVHGLRFTTDSGGWIAFDEPGLMGRRVYFSVRSPGYAFPKDTSASAGWPLTSNPASAPR